MEKRKKYQKDIVFIVALVVLLLAVALFQRALRREGGVVMVYRDGEFFASYPLGEDREILLQDAGGSNCLAIRDGKAFIRDADCPDRICVGQGAVSHAGEAIICLPHKLVVEISGVAEDAAYDAIVQ